MARSPELTLLNVIQAVREVAATEQETLATVIHLLTSGQVRLSEEAIGGMKALVVTTTAAAYAVRAWLRSTGVRGGASRFRSAKTSQTSTARDEGPRTRRRTSWASP